MRPRYRLLRDELAVAEPGTDAGASPAAPSPATAPVVAPGATDWKAAIPEALRADKLWDRHKDATSVFQSYHEAQKTIGGMVKKPGADAKPEEIAAFRERMGVPKTAADYPVPTVPEGQTLDQARWDRWTGHFHKLGLTPEQVNGIAALESEERQGALTGVKQEWAAGLDKLKGEWGDALYSKNVTLAARAIDRHMSPEGKQFLDDSGLGNHPELVKAWASIGALLAEDGYIEGRVAGVPSTDEATARIAEIRASPDYKPDSPRFKALDEELERLYKIKFGTGPRTAG